MKLLNWFFIGAGSLLETSTKTTFSHFQVPQKVVGEMLDFQTRGFHKRKERGVELYCQNTAV